MFLFIVFIFHILRWSTHFTKWSHFHARDNLHQIFVCRYIRNDQYPLYAKKKWMHKYTYSHIKTHRLSNREAWIIFPYNLSNHFPIQVNDIHLIRAYCYSMVIWAEFSSQTPGVKLGVKRWEGSSLIELLSWNKWSMGVPFSIPYHRVFSIGNFKEWPIHLIIYTVNEQL